MKPALTRLPLVALLAASSLVACSDDTDTGQELNCEIRVSPGALALGTLCLDATSEPKTFEIENVGQAECLVDLALAGMSPQHFSISAEHVSIPVGVKQPITVTYHPSSEAGAVAGEPHFARVMITSNAKENGTFELAVDGETASTETKGILSLSCDGVKKCPVGQDDGEACCRVVSTAGPGENGYPTYGRDYLSEVKFGDVQNGQSVTVPLKVTNLGCGQLDIAELAFTPTTGAGFCDPGAVTVLTPMPVSVAGSVSAQVRNSAIVEVKFTPTQANCSYFASVKVDSNDPDIVAGTQTEIYGKFNLQGAGTEGLLVSYPANVAFGDIATNTTVEQVIEISNNGRRAAEVSSVSLRNGPGAFQITKLERPNCDGTFTEIPAGSTFVLKETDLQNHCGEDQVNATVTFTPDDAGVFQNYLEVNYGFGILSVQLSGRSEPELVATPSTDVRFYGPRPLGCEPSSCTADDVPNATCDGVCATDADCDGGPCVGGVCAENDEATCTETCGAAERVIRLCNNGHAPLKFDDADQGGGLVVTGADGGAPPTHTPVPGINDPARDGKPLFSITQNGCADVSGNGITLGPNECCEATIHYLDTRNGGSPEGEGFHRAELHIYTNDPGYPRDGSNGGGLALDLMARSDYDFDPVAKFTAYDLEKGPGEFNGPRQGKMAVLDATASVDPTCDWSQPSCDQTKVNPISSYKWRIVAVSGVGEYVQAMVGEIDLADPNKNCPSWINGGKCFEVPDLGAATGRIVHFYPDVEAPRNYRIELTVTDMVCSPPHQGVTVDDIQVSG